MEQRLREKAKPNSRVFPLNHRPAQAADGVRQIDCVGVVKVLDGEHALLCVRPYFQNVTALNAGQQAALDGRREQVPIFLNKNVVNSAFRDFVAEVEKQHVIKTSLGSSLESLSVEGPVRGFVKEHGVLRIGALGGDADPKWFSAGEDGAAGHEFPGDVQSSVAIEEETDFAGRCGWLKAGTVAGVGQQSGLDGGAVARKSKVAR
jgi:hypothetical protein